MLEEYKTTKEVEIYLNLIRKHKCKIHLSIKNMNINKIYKFRNIVKGSRASDILRTKERSQTP